MDFKYKIADVAKDFGISAKRAIDTVAAVTGETRKPGGTFEESEVNGLLEALTRETAVDSLEEYLASGKKQPEPKPAPKKAEAKPQPAKKQEKPAAEAKPQPEARKPQPRKPERDEYCRRGEYEVQRLHRKRSDAVYGEGYHLFEGVLALARQSFAALIVHLFRLIPHHGHDPAQEQVDLSELLKPLDGALRHKAVVGVVEHHIHAQRLHYLVKALGGGTLEKAVLVPARTHSVDHVVALIVIVKHLVHGAYVVLQVGVHRNYHVGALCGGVHARKQRALMPAVARKFYALEQPVCGVQPRDYAPRPVSAAVVHEQHSAVFGYRARAYQGGHLFFQPLRRRGQHLLFVVAGHYNVKSVRHNSAFFLILPYIFYSFCAPLSTPDIAKLPPRRKLSLKNTLQN